jgi:hypothetical protein
VTCPECHRMMPDDSGCPWCVTADVARNPSLPRAVRLAVDRPESPRTALDAPEAPSDAKPAPEGLTAARAELAAAIDRKQRRTR